MMDTGEKKHLPLGENHFYYLDDKSEIDLNFYLTWSDQMKSDVKVAKFGAKWGAAPTPIDLIHHPSGHKTFQAIRRAWPDGREDGFKFIESSYKTTQLTDDLAQMIRGKNFLYYIKVFANKKDHRAFVIYPPELEEDEDFQAFMTYINLTR
ncbi:MAG: hypothetical protein M0R77_02925 [Gammaproteobacteria bacterium]|nr:hypothetical protein [Gammaproteobacteria bacterium]